MGKQHSYDFFGQMSAVFINSKAEELFIWLKHIKKKPDGVWEKPSSGEGRSVKMGLEENIAILKVLKREAKSWSGFHSFKDKKTAISFSWENEQASKLWINIDDRSKMLSKVQAEVLKLLYEHIINEQIELGTVPKYDGTKQL